MTRRSESRILRAGLALVAIAAALLSDGCAGKPVRKAAPPARRPSVPGRRLELPPPGGQCPVPPRPRKAEPPAPARTPARAAEPAPAADRPVRVLVAGPSKSVTAYGCPVRIRRSDGSAAGEWNGSFTLVPEGGRIRVFGSLLGESVELEGDASLEVAGRRLGGCRVRVANRQGALVAVAVLPLEEYVAAVLSREGSPSFRPASLAALAVAVRTYAACAAERPRDPDYDLLNGVEDQVFDGLDRLLPQFRAAAGETRGLLLRSGDALAAANYHSTCGGRTESAADAWGKPAPHLVSVECGDCRESPSFRWELRMTLEEGKRIAQSLGFRARNDLRIEAVSETPTGRASRIRLASGGASREVPAAAFRQAAGSTRLKSLRMTIRRTGDGWRISGEGYGHGVGLCQWGAEGMARRGIGFREILARYYPGTRLSP